MRVIVVVMHWSLSCQVMPASRQHGLPPRILCAMSLFVSHTHCEAEYHTVGCNTQTFRCSSAWFAYSCSAGTVMSEDRKRQIYSVAQEYNLLIVEDDPYYLLQYRDGAQHHRHRP